MIERVSEGVTPENKVDCLFHCLCLSSREITLDSFNCFPPTFDDSNSIKYLYSLASVFLRSFHLKLLNFSILLNWPKSGYCFVNLDAA